MCKWSYACIEYWSDVNNEYYNNGLQALVEIMFKSNIDYQIKPIQALS